MRTSSTTEGRLWLGLYALLCGGSVALALLLAIAHSVGAWAWPAGGGLDGRGWQALFSDAEFWRSLGYSALLTAITLCVAVLSALLLSATLGAHLRHGWLARALFVPLAVPPVVAALLAFVLLADSGLLSRVAFFFGWTAMPADFPSLLFESAGYGIVLTHLAMITPLFVLLFERLAQTLGLPLLLLQAETLGASRRQAWQHIALPLLLRQARPVLAVYGAALLGAYELPLLIGAPQPGMVSVTIARAVAGYDLTQHTTGFAMASVYLIILIAVWALFGARREISGGSSL